MSMIARRNALFALYALPGLGLSSWVARTPDVRDAVGASTEQMGWVLFGLSIGSMIGILGSGTFVARFGTRFVIAACSVVLALGVWVIGIGAMLSDAPLVAAGLACFGFGIGSCEVAVNIEGIEVERLIGRSVMPALHGFFSLGTVLGALSGMLLTAVGFPIVLHMLGVGIVIVLVLMGTIGFIPPVFGKRAGDDRDHGRRTRSSQQVWRDPRLLLVSGVVLALALAEGAANDWLPLLMVDGHGFEPAWGSGIFAVFAIFMTLSRFAGGMLVNRFGGTTMLTVSSLLGALGLAGVVLLDSQIAVIVAVALWGIGASLGFPVALSVAGETESGSGAESAARVAFAAALGYVAFLVGPPVLGVLGEQVGLRSAMLLVLALVCAAVALTLIMRRGQRGRRR